MADNVALTRCFYCGKPDRVLFATRYKPNGEPLYDLSPLDGKAIDHKPCPECEKLMQQGIMLLSISNNSKPDDQNPFRTGKMCVIKEETFRKIFDIDLQGSRIAFICDRVWDIVGLPNSEKEE